LEKRNTSGCYESQDESQDDPWGLFLSRTKGVDADVVPSRDKNQSKLEHTHVTDRCTVALCAASVCCCYPLPLLKMREVTNSSLRHPPAIDLNLKWATGHSLSTPLSFDQGAPKMGFMRGYPVPHGKPTCEQQLAERNLLVARRLRMNPRALGSTQPLAPGYFSDWNSNRHRKAHPHQCRRQIPWRPGPI